MRGGSLVSCKGKVYECGAGLSYADGLCGRNIGLSRLKDGN